MCRLSSDTQIKVNRAKSRFSFNFCLYNHSISTVPLDISLRPQSPVAKHQLDIGPLSPNPMLPSTDSTLAPVPSALGTAFSHPLSQFILDFEGPPLFPWFDFGT